MAPAACPECGNTDLMYDEVDIGVGIQHGPAYCNLCGWNEDVLDDWPSDFDGMDDFVDL